MRRCVAIVAFVGLTHGVDALALAGQPAETARPTAEGAVAVGIGLAWADQEPIGPRKGTAPTIEVPVTVEIARPEAPSANRPSPRAPGRGSVSLAPAADRAAPPAEWIRVCGPNGCRWVPRPAGRSEPKTAPADPPDASPAPPVAGGEESECDGIGCGSSAGWRLFGRRR